MPQLPDKFRWILTATLLPWWVAVWVTRDAWIQEWDTWIQEWDTVLLQLPSLNKTYSRHSVWHWVIFRYGSVDIKTLSADINCFGVFSFQPHSVPTPSAQPQHHTTASTSRADVSSQRQLRLRQQYLPHVNYDTLTLMQCISSFFAPPPPLPTVRTVTRHGNYIQRCPVSSCTGCSSGRSSNCTRDPHGTRQLNHTTTILSITHRTLTHTPTYTCTYDRVPIPINYVSYTCIHVSMCSL